MATKPYNVNFISLECLISGDSDPVSEFYGNFSYRAQEESTWTTLVATSDSSPWVIQDGKVTKDGYYTAPKNIIILRDHIINLPTTATFVEIRASIQEYDPSVFDADEDLGTCTISISLVPPIMQGKGEQGNSSTGKVAWWVDINIPIEGDKFSWIFGASGIKTETTETNVVTIYQDSNYQGASQTLGLGSYDFGSLGLVGNDQASSLKVPQGLKATFYEHGGFTGRTKTFTEDTPWVGDDFNDITSGIKIEKIS
jgi:hypothetical protein